MTEAKSKMKRETNQMGIYLYILKLFTNYEKRNIKIFSFAL